MSRFLRISALFIVFCIVTTSCEEALFTTEPRPTTGEAPGSDDGADPSDDGPQAACGLDTFPGDTDFADTVCRYQAALIRALAAGVTVDGELTDRVGDAILLWLTDPGGARDVVADAIDEIDGLIDAIPELSTSTVTDLTDDLFACVSEASDLLRTAFDRVEFGGVPIPELEDWQSAFDDAAALAGQGDIGGALDIVCTLADDMESVLVQS